MTTFSNFCGSNAIHYLAGNISIQTFYLQTFSILARLGSSVGWFKSNWWETSKTGFLVEAHLISGRGGSYTLFFLISQPKYMYQYIVYMYVKGYKRVWMGCND